MAVKPNGMTCQIKEQIIEDPISGLTLQFVKYDKKSTVGCQLKIFGNFKHGNRDIIFDEEGAEAGGGTFFGKFCRPNWLKEIK